MIAATTFESVLSKPDALPLPLRAEWVPMSTPINGEVAAALGQFFFGGSGPSHTTLSRAFQGSGLSQHDHYDVATGTPNKQQRVLDVCGAATRSPDAARKLADYLLDALRLHGSFKDSDNTGLTNDLRGAFLHAGWALSDDGRLGSLGSIDLETGGRTALDDQIERLRRNQGDPAALLGGAKELLEAIAKFVLEEAGRPAPPKMDFPGLIAVSFQLLGFDPSVIKESEPGAKQLRAIYQSAKTIANAVNELRNQMGTGHGRTSSVALTQETARYVIREATHIAEMMLTTHDRQMGRVSAARP